MRKNRPLLITLAAGIFAAGCTFFSETDGDKAPAATVEAPISLSSAVFAGGCFWCVESDFDKVEGVYDTQSGYTGGALENPTYKKVSYEDTGHYEAVKVTYDPAKVSYDELVEYFFRTVDPTDAKGQFCDKGDSYRTAVFVATDAERSMAEAEISEIDESGVLKSPIVTKVIDASTFWPAEEYHQDYYTKNPLKYRYYRNGCGRDKRLAELWGDPVK
jgi:peptide-methionine (S)-S-oxide reductase